ncbi:MAG: cyclic pyranopterin monophosphate synthase MoaC [Candidatus Geothermincolia bacterium]
MSNGEPKRAEKKSKEPRLTHIDEQGRARMVDVGAKRVTERVAVAQAEVLMQPETLRLIMSAGLKKGDALSVAQVAGIMAAKRTAELIPMCHPIRISSVEVDFRADEKRSSITVTVTAKTKDRTGIEMEAMTGAATAALTIYDMCKGVDRAVTITNVQLMKKSGGRSGTFQR